MYPVLIKIGTLVIDAYSVTAVIAFLAMIFFIRREGMRVGLGEDQVKWGTFWAVAGCLLGGRAVYLLVNFEFILQSPGLAFAIWEGGLVSFGGISGSLLAVAIYARRQGLPVVRTLDYACLAPHLAIAIGRIGCFCAGCDFGKPAPDAVFSVVFSDPRSLIPIELLGIPLHPTQLYMSLANLIVFLIGYILLRTDPPPGRVFSLVAMVYSIFRFAIEFVRGDTQRGFVVDEALSSGQFFCLVWFLIGLYVFVKSVRRSTISCS
ncbi:MAG: prolipoprotein diacylglyceryl transferase [Proteobacteria bacterium]|nr:prolipoprotein diacylglyceryl transferase [Pseudomonadota bacterium]